MTYKNKKMVFMKTTVNILQKNNSIKVVVSDQNATLYNSVGGAQFSVDKGILNIDMFIGEKVYQHYALNLNESLLNLAGRQSVFDLDVSTKEGGYRFPCVNALCLKGKAR